MIRSLLEAVTEYCYWILLTVFLAHSVDTHRLLIDSCLAQSHSRADKRKSRRITGAPLLNRAYKHHKPTLVANQDPNQGQTRPNEAKPGANCERSIA